MSNRTVPYFEGGNRRQVDLEDPRSVEEAEEAGWVPGFEYATGPIPGAELLLPVIFNDLELRQKIAAAGGPPPDNAATLPQLAMAFLRAKGLTAYSRLEVTAVDPDTGVATDPLTIEGAGFSHGSAGTPTVTIGGVAATSIVVVSDTEITCVAPAHANGAVDVVVTNAHGTSTLDDGFTYDA